MNNRDDFTEKTKKTLQDRVNNKCSNPTCRCATSGPNSIEIKATRKKRKNGVRSCISHLTS